MRILIDGYNLSLDKGTGIATYARNLSYNINSLGHKVEILYGSRRAPNNTALMRDIAFFDEHVGTGNKYILRLMNLKDAVTNPFSFSSYQVPLTGQVITTQFSSKLPYFDAIHNAPNIYNFAHTYFSIFGRSLKVKVTPQPDIAHWTYPIPIYVAGAKNIYTFHDLIPLKLPFTTLDNKFQYHKMVKHIADNADHVVTVSDTSRQDILDLLKIPESKVTNTYQSVEIPDKYLSIPEEKLIDELKGTFRLDHKKYLLFFGSIEPKKNLGRIIEAFLASNVDIPLVIVGAQAWKSEQELRLLVDDNTRSLIQIGNETLVKRRIIRLDYVTFPQLINLIRGARCTLFPSLYEGFGLPILESMVCGTPVISSNLGATKEIAGDSAILVDPYDTRAIKDTIIRVVSDDNLIKAKSLAGRETAARFSGQNYQSSLSKLYNKIL